MGLGAKAIESALLLNKRSGSLCSSRKVSPGCTQSAGAEFYTLRPHCNKQELI